MDALEAQNNRYNGTTAIWFTSHAQIDARGWNNIQEFKGDYHPLVGYYRSDGPQVLDKQLCWMQRAGIDLIVYGVYGYRIKNVDMTARLLGREVETQTYKDMD
jgi:hypothetical protein